MEGFNENERKGLIGKIINYFDNGNASLQPANGMGFSAREKKQILLGYFTIEELKQIYNKINECEYKTIFEKINPFLTNDKIEKIFDYLLSWKNTYWGGRDMSDFLCGMLGKIRVRTKAAETKVFNKITNKTNDDLSNMVKKYASLGGNRYKIHRNSRHNTKNKRSRHNKKNKRTKHNTRSKK